MRILIVNAHSIKGKNKFEFFVNSIMNVNMLSFYSLLDYFRIERINRYRK